MRSTRCSDRELTLFGGDDSLKQFWKQLATAKVIQDA